MTYPMDLDSGEYFFEISNFLKSVIFKISNIYIRHGSQIKRQRWEGSYLILETLVQQNQIKYHSATAIVKAISAVILDHRTFEYRQQETFFSQIPPLNSSEKRKEQETFLEHELKMCNSGSNSTTQDSSSTIQQNPIQQSPEKLIRKLLQWSPLEKEVVEDSKVRSNSFVPENQNKDLPAGVQYSFEHSFERWNSLAAQFYNAANAGSINYHQLFYGEHPSQKASFHQEDEYWSPSTVADTESELLSAEEAQDKFTEIQYAVVMGNRFSVNFHETRKLDLWIKFNPALFSAFESLYAVTRDVDYSSS